MADLHFQLQQNSREYQDYLSSLNSWEQEMKKKEGKKNNPKINKLALPQDKPPPPVRNAEVLKEQLEEKKKRIASWDYRSWDQFDVDAACEQVDNILPEKTSQAVSESVVSGTDQVSEESRKKAAEEKERGNLCFKNKDFERALMHYNECIRLDPNEMTYYLNRSMTFLKLKRYEETELDCSKVLELDPKSMKALWRRGTARQYMGKLEDAMRDFDSAYVLAPGDQVLKKERKELQAALVSKSNSLPKKSTRRRIPIEEIGEPPSKIEKEKRPLESKKSTSVLIEEVESLTHVPAAKVQEKPQIKATEFASLQNTNKASEMSKSFGVPTNAFEFERDWKVVRSSLQSVCEFLKPVDPSLFPTLIKSNLQVEHISCILRMLDQFYKNDVGYTFKCLQGLSRVSRLSMNMMFLSKSDKQLLSELIQGLESSGVNVQDLKKAFGTVK